MLHREPGERTFPQYMFMYRTTRFYAFGLLAAGLFCSGVGLHAQPIDGGTTGTQRDLLDGVAAVVGNEVVLVSDVMQQVALYAREKKTDARDPALQREVLDAIIDEKLVLTRAREDSINVTEDEITRAVDFQVQRILSQFNGSEERVEKAYGMSMDKIRRESREIIRQQFLTERVRQIRFAALKPTDNDVQEFYRIYRDSLPPVPDQVELQSIVLLVKPTAEAKERTIALARSIIDSIRAGEDFASFAQRYSSDPGSAANGGELGFVEKGKFVAEFENAARRLGINEISDPVESTYGIHIIQVLDRRGDATRSRHILLRLAQSQTEQDSMIAQLKSLRARALAGEDFAELARQFSQDEESKGLGGSLGKIPVDQLPPESKSMIAALKDGDISEPAPVILSPTESGYQIVRLAQRIPAHPIDPQADRAQLERLATLYKQTNEYRKWIAELRNEIYWEIKTNF